MIEWEIGNTMKPRHELKFYIETSDIYALNAKLSTVATLDQGGQYIINSLYFDNYQDKAVIDKLSGQSYREKFRLRYYNQDTSFMRLEKKSKRNNMTYKESEKITLDQVNDILQNNFILPDKPLLQELYSKMRIQMLRPRTIVEYKRSAYAYKPGNVRITIDTDIRASDFVHKFLTGFTSIPATKYAIVEVKYDEFLPSVIYNMIQMDKRNQTEFSKYAISRMI